MDLVIKNKQIYDDSEDSSEIIAEGANVIIEDDIVKIKYDDNEIILNLNDNSVKILRKENDLFIKLNEECVSNYDTPYGKFNLKIFGEEFNFTEKPFCLKFSYTITLNNSIEYKNFIEIFEV